MTTQAVATGLWLTIHQRLKNPEFVQITGFGVEQIEKRALLKPGGLLTELEHYKTHGNAYMGIGFRTCLSFFLCSCFKHPYDQQATGQPLDYWLKKIDD